MYWFDHLEGSSATAVLQQALAHPARINYDEAVALSKLGVPINFLYVGTFSNMLIANSFFASCTRGGPYFPLSLEALVELVEGLQAERSEADRLEESKAAQSAANSPAGTEQDEANNLDGDSV